jgi:hypothetical protein
VSTEQLIVSVGIILLAARLFGWMFQYIGLIDSINPGPDKNLSSEQASQNIQVFNDMPAGQMARTIAVFAVVLGVDCSHCHLADQWDDDDKPAKQVTREMVQMVSGINQ